VRVSQRQSTPTGPPLSKWLARRRRVAWIRGALIVGVLGGALIWRVVQRHSTLADAPRLIGQVTGVESDCTLRFRETGGGETLAVKLLGLAFDHAGAEADRASAWLRQNVSGHGVVLGFDEHTRRSPRGDLLAYVYLPDGRLVNQTLIELSLARPDPRTPHALDDWFTRLHNKLAAHPPKPATDPPSR
jgi:hypothetical protein